MHCQKAQRSAIGHRQNLGSTSENLSFENAKAPEYGALCCLSRQLNPPPAKLARPLQ